MRAYGRFAAAGPRRARVGAVPAVIAGTQGQRVLAGGWGASGINVVDLSATLPSKSSTCAVKVCGPGSLANHTDENCGS